ncbi:P-type ATPase [Sulfitobacter sp. SK012]|uniref:P-type ATPase n=1 Tax=Sulfitobacter sp. SK012 TaxID=1389005 RepID=UPI0020C75A83|nr:hypothetical protein [Sulfitobacter sp. SK012]
MERNGEITALPIAEISVDDLIHLRPGDRVAVDGAVTLGTRWVDEAMITGEPLPVEKIIGTEATGGTVNGMDALVFRATRVGRDPALSQALVAGVAVLIIACPCAMGLAVSTSIMVGTGRAAEMGALFRKGGALQGLQDIAVIALDRTGAQTIGHPTLTTR